MNHRALPLSADWPTRRPYVPQGCTQQGRLVPSIPFGGCDCSAGKTACDCIAPAEAASACTEIGAEPERQDDSADSEVALYMLKVVAAICATCFLIWARARGYV